MDISVREEALAILRVIGDEVPVAITRGLGIAQHLILPKVEAQLERLAARAFAAGIEEAANALEEGEPDKPRCMCPTDRRGDNPIDMFYYGFAHAAGECPKEAEYKCCQCEIPLCGACTSQAFGDTGGPYCSPCSNPNGMSR